MTILKSRTYYGCGDWRLVCFGEALGGLALLPLGQIGCELLFSEVGRLTLDKSGGLFATDVVFQFRN